MNNTQEFIYKGYVQGFAHELPMHLLGKKGEKVRYYLSHLNTKPEIGDRIEINYNHTMPYRNGQLLVGGEV